MQRFLDAADTIYAATFFISYYDRHGDAASLMRSQKIEDLKIKGLWDSSPLHQIPEIQIPTDPTDFGFNIFVTGAGTKNQNERASYLDLLDLTSSHINHPGWACLDFTVCLDLQNKGIRFHKCPAPNDQIHLGFIRLDSGVLNNQVICNELGVRKLTAKQINQYLLNGKVVVPTQPFGSLMRGGKLLALMAMSNQFRQIFADRFNQPDKCLFYVTSLYGSSKNQSQYSQLDRYLRYVGNTTGKSFPLRIKEPHNQRLLKFFHSRGFYREQFVPESGSSTADRTHRAILNFIRDSLRANSGRSSVKEIRTKFKQVTDQWDEGITEVKRTYISDYGFQNWREFITGKDKILKSDYESQEQFDIECLVEYWKSKLQKKDWGFRKVLRDHQSFSSKPIFLNELFRDDTFHQIR